MQCRDVEFAVEQEGLAPLPEAARAHVATCSHCRELVADLQTIVSVANELPAEVEPPARVWVSLRTQLELEGIIKAPVVAAGGERSRWWHGFNDLFRSRALATATVFFASPHYAWYFVWLTVLLCVAPWWPAFWLTLTAVLLYCAPQTGHVPIWVGFVIYGGFVMLACADIVWRLFGARIGEQFGSHRAD